MTAAHSVELLRDGKGIYGVGAGDGESIIFRPDRLPKKAASFFPIYQQITGGFRHGMFSRTAEEQLRQSIHHNMLRRAGLDWPPTDQPWWSDDKKQQDRNRQTYHGLRLGSLSVLNSLIRTALAEAADQDALKMARRFPFKGRENVYTASARSRRALQLFEAFPVLGLAIYSIWMRNDPVRVVAIKAVERGHSLRHIAGLMGVPMALRRVKPGAAALVFGSVNTFGEHVCDIFRVQPDLINAWLPNTQRKMKVWLQSVWFADLISPGYDFAGWVARHVFDLGSTFDAIDFRLRDLTDWVRACSPTDEFDFIEAEAAHGKEFVTRKFTPCMSLATVLRLSHEWHEAVADNMTGPQFEFPAPWLPAQTIDGLDFLPITHSADLYREGKLMHHCIGTYADHVRDGKCYIYSIRSDGQRVAAVELISGTNRAVGDDDRVTVGQLRGPCNAKVAPAIEKATRKWLRAVRAARCRVGRASC